MPQNLEHSGTSWKGQSLKHADSIVDTFDPRVRVIWVTLFACVVVLSHSLVVGCVGLMCSLLVARIAKLNLQRTLRRMIAMDMFMIALIVLLPFTTPGVPLFEFAGLTASKDGLEHALLIAVKANAVVLALLSMVGTMSANTFGHAMARLKSPEKLIHLLLFTVRYLDVIGQEYKRMHRAMKARAFTVGPNRHTWRSIGYLVGMLLIRALERSERIMDAMKCRGYNGRFYLVDDSNLGRRDHVFIVFCVPFFMLLIGLNLI